MKLRKYIIPFLSLLVILSCSKKEEKKAEVLRPVKYHVVGTSNDQKIRTFSGVAKAGDEIGLSFRSGGVITTINVSVGQKVKKGDLIATLDNVEAKLAYEKSVSALNSAASDKNTAKTELDRIKSLYEKNSISLSEYQAAKNAYQNALAQFESAKRNKSIQQTQVNYGYIYAPKDGVIADTDGAVNESVQAGHLFAILNAGDQMEIEIGLSESTVNQVALGMEASITFSSIAGETFMGNMIEIAQIAASDAATYPVSIAIVNPSSAIRSGMAANVTLNLNANSDIGKEVLTVPIKAVGEDGNGNFVFLIETANEQMGQVKKQPIEIGELTSGGFEIKAGLSEGQLIATAGLQTLLDGQKVRLQ
ncbi:MAG: efflux RND transporter periplasmic adaptor subunit [Bacteroidota bacterium]